MRVKSVAAFYNGYVGSIEMGDEGTIVSEYTRHDGFFPILVSKITWDRYPGMIVPSHDIRDGGIISIIQ